MMNSVIDDLILMLCTFYLIVNSGVIATDTIANVSMSTVDINNKIERENLTWSLGQNLTMVNSENTMNIKEPNEITAEWNMQVTNNVTSEVAKEMGNQTVTTNLTSTSGDDEGGNKRQENLAISKNDVESDPQSLDNVWDLTDNVSTHMGSDLSNLNIIHHRVKRESEVQKDNSHRYFDFETNGGDYYDFGQAVIIAPRVAPRDAKAEAPVTTDTSCWKCDGERQCSYVRCDYELRYNSTISPKGFSCIEWKYEDSKSKKVTHRGECAYAESSIYDPCEQILLWKNYDGTIRNCRVCYSDGCNYELKPGKKHFNTILAGALLVFGTFCLCLAASFICLRAKPYKRKYWVKSKRSRCRVPSCVCSGTSRYQAGRGDAPSVCSSCSEKVERVLFRNARSGIL